MGDDRSWRDFDRANGYNHIEVLPQNGAVGAEIRCVDLSANIGDDQWAEIERAFAENVVIYFRN